jgi:RNA polymerase sigma factor (sigma-70 family)
MTFSKSDDLYKSTVMKEHRIVELIENEHYKQAAENIYGYFPVVKKFIVTASGSKQDAEDVFQEAILILFRNIKDQKFEHKSSVETYLYSICRHLWLDVLRKRKREFKHQSEFGLQFSSDQISDDISEQKDISLAETAFQMLGEKCRELLQLFYFKKQNMVSIANQLGFGSEKVAKNQKYRCIEKAKEHLKTLQSQSHE